MRLRTIDSEDFLSYPGDVLKTKLVNAAVLIRDYGLRTFLFQILPWHFSRRFTVYSQTLASQIQAGPFSGPFELRMELATEKNLSHIMGLRPGLYSRKQLKHRFREGHMCFIGWVRNDPVHIRWFFKKSRYLPYINRRVILSSRDIWSDEAYTHPGYRHKGIYTSTAVQTNCLLADMGFRRVSCAVASWNSAPLQSVLKRGMQPVGDIVYRNIFLFRKYSFSGLIKDLEGDKIAIEDLP